MTKVILVLLLSALPNDKFLLQEEVVDMCEVKEFVYTQGSQGEQTFKYRLFVPEPMEEGKKYPLFLWLHGYGGAIASNNHSQLAYFHFVFWEGKDRSEYPFFVLFPQCPKKNPGWYQAENTEDQMATVALAMVEKTKEEYPIDEDRIYLWGISGGATSVLRMISEHPHLFAAAGASSASGCPSSFWPTMIYTPFWEFHGGRDKKLPSKGIEDTVAGINEAGGIAHVTVFPRAGHGTWNYALQHDDVFGWMLHQKRGEPSSWCYPGRPSRRRIWSAFRKAVIPLSGTVFAFIITLSVIFYQFRKMKSTSSTSSTR